MSVVLRPFSGCCGSLKPGAQSLRPPSQRGSLGSAFSFLSRTWRGWDAQAGAEGVQ